MIRKRNYQRRQQRQDMGKDKKKEAKGRQKLRETKKKGLKTKGVGVCKILKYPEPSVSHREYFESLFDMSCFVWFQIYSESERTIHNLLDYVVCVQIKSNMSVCNKLNNTLFLKHVVLLFFFILIIV